MSETGQSGPDKASDAASDRKWDWSNPQTVLAAAGIIAGLAGSVFGVAMAAPYGQDLLCSAFGVSCPRIALKSPQMSVNAIEFGDWCNNWLEQQAKSEFPPPGYTGSTMDCSLDFSVAEPQGFGGRISYGRVEADGTRVAPESPGGVVSDSGMVLAVHLSMEHTAPAVDTAITLRALCRRSEATTGQMAQVPCELRPPGYDAADPAGVFVNTYSSEHEAEGDKPRPAGAIRVTLSKDALDFVERWRLDIDDHPNADLAPGLYSVEIAAGAPGEPVEPVRVGTTFEVYPR